jgi:myo-inositol-1(or 4)-monophosphatase
VISKVEPIIRKAGDILLSYYGKLNSSDVSDKAAWDFVTIADKASEDYIISELKTIFPDIAILAEESGLSDPNSNSYWIIDPLDGTKNFIQDIPYFAISIGLEVNKEIIFGAVYSPLQNELFYAEKNKGAFLNNAPISVSKKQIFSEGFISTGFPFKKRELSAQYLNSFSDIFSAVTNIRRCGAAALDLAYLAAGRYDGFWEIGLSPWDIAGASIIIKEANGIITDFDNKSNYISTGFVVAGNQLFHRHLLAHIQKNFKEKG